MAILISWSPQHVQLKAQPAKQPKTSKKDLNETIKDHLRPAETKYQHMLVYGLLVGTKVCFYIGGAENYSIATLTLQADITIIV